VLRINVLAVLCVGLLIACGPDESREGRARSDEAVGQVRAGLTVSPTSWTFAAQQRGTSSAAKQFALSDPGGGSGYARTCELTIGGTEPFDLIEPSDGSRTKSRTGVSVAKGGTTNVDVVFVPTVVGTANGTLTIGCTGTLSGTAMSTTNTVTLSGTGSSSATVGPSSLTFGFQKTGTGSQTKPVVISNSSTVAFTITSISVPTDFEVVGFTPGTSVPANSSNTTISVRFKPTTPGAGASTGSLTINTSEGTSFPVTLSGTRVLLATHISPTSSPSHVSPTSFPSFGAQRVGVASSPQTLTLYNAGENDLDITSHPITYTTGTGTFTLVSAPTTPMAQGTSQVLQVKFTPDAEGGVTGALTLNTSETDPTDESKKVSVRLGLSGTGVRPDLVLSPNPLAFQDVRVGSPSTKSVTVSNNGSSSISITGITKGGNADFTLLNPPGTAASGSIPATPNVPFTLAPGQSQVLSVTYNPANEGSVTGTLTITSSDSEFASRDVNLTGKGVRPNLVLSPNPLAFGGVRVGSPSTKSVTVSNNGTGSISITGISKGGNADFTLLNPPGTAASGSIPATPNVPFTLAPGESQVLSVTYNPSDVGADTGTLTITSSDSEFASRIVNLTGEGVRPVVLVNPNPLAFNEQRLNIERTETVTVSNTGSGPITITGITQGGSPTFTLVNPPTPPFVIAAGTGAQGLTVKFTPTAERQEAGTLTLATADPAYSSGIIINLSGEGVNPALVLEPDPLAFNNLRVGTSDTKTVTLRNTGTGTIYITSIGTSGHTAYSLVSSRGTPFGLARGATESLTVKYNPTVETTTGNTDMGTLSVSGGAGIGSPWLTVTANLTGKGVKPNLVFDPSPLAFGDVRAGASDTKTVKVKNAGSGPITLSNITKSSGNLFTILSPATPLTTPLTLAAGDEQELSVRYSPSATETGATDQGSITVTSTDPDFLSRVVNLTGTGVKPILVLDPATPLAFGDVRLDTESTKTLTLRNNGSGPITIDLAKSANPVFTLVSPLGSSFTLGAGVNTVLTVKFKPTTLLQEESATLTVDSSDPGFVRRTVALTGRGVKPNLVLDPSTGLAFDEVRVGTSSPTKTVTVRNTGSGPITISGLSTGIGSPFSLVTPPQTPFTVAPGGTQVLSVKYSPGAEASHPGTLTITTLDSEWSSVPVPLSGQGVKPNLVLSPNPLAFGDVRVKEEFVKMVEVLNTGTGPITFSGLSTGTSPGFTIVNPPTTPFTLDKVTGRILLSVKFSPDVEGAVTGALTLTSSDLDFGSPSVTLTGKGVKPNLVFDPNPLAFGDVRVGSSPTRTVTVTNNGSGPITISNITKTGEAFTLDSPLGTSFPLAAGAHTVLSVRFSPTPEATTPSYTGSITLTTEDADLPSVTLNLTGKGVKPNLVLSPNPLAFGNQRVNTERTETVTVRNTGTGSITISNLSITGAGFSLDNPPTTSFTMAAGGTQLLTVKFRPTTSDAESTGTLSVATTDSDYALSNVALTGQGVRPNLVLEPNPLDFGPQNVGDPSPVRTVTVRNTGTGPVTINSMSLPTGAPFSIVSSTAAFTLQPNGSANSADIQVRFSPTRKESSTAPLTLSTDYAGQSSVAATLNGEGVTKLEVEPDNRIVDFGKREVGQPVTLTVKLTNASSASIGGLTVLSVAAPFSATQPQSTMLGARGAATTFTVTFTPNAQTLFTALLTVRSDASHGDLVLTLRGTGVVPVAKLSAPVANAPAIASLDFAGVRVNATAQLTVRLTNTGEAPLSFTQRPAMLSNTNGGTSVFAYQGPDTMTLAGGTHIDFQVSFQPKARINYSDTLIINSNATNSPTQLSLTGIGADPELKLDRTSIFFGDVRVGSRSTGVPVTINNTGNAPVSLQNLPVSGPFEVALPLESDGGTAVLPRQLSVGTSFTFSVIFKPAEEKAVDGGVTVVSDMNSDSTSPTLSVALSGNGTTSLLAKSVSSLDFGGQRVRQISGVLPVVLTNPGKAELEISQFVFSNSMFNVSSPLPLPSESVPLKIAAGQQKTISVTFTPSTLGEARGQFFIISNAANANDAGTLSLVGEGIDGQLSMTPSVVSFDGDGGVEVGGSGSQQSVSIKNIGGATLTISGLEPPDGGPFTVSGLPIGQTDAGVILQPEGEWPLTVSFTPQARGFVSTSAIIRSDSVISPAFNMLLKGTGVAAAVDLLPKDVYFGQSNVGVSTTQEISIKNVGERDLYVSNISFAEADAGVSDAGLGAALDFRIGGDGDAGTVAFPMMVGPGSSKIVPLKFTPRETGPRRARAIVYTNDKVVEASLLGEGVSPNLAVTSVDLVNGTLDFKSVVMNKPSTARVLRLTNTGNGSLTLNKVTPGGADATYFILTTLSLPITLQPGAFTDVSVALKPDAERQFSAQLVIESNDPDNPSMPVPMIGTGVRQQVELSRTSMDFGQQLLRHTSNPRSVLVTNSSDTNLTLQSIEVQGLGASQFTLLQPLGLPLVLSPGKAQRVELTFTPQEEVDVNCVLKISVGDAQSLSVMLHGKGIPAVLSIAPSPLDFGGVRIGSGNRVNPLTITNVSSDPIVLAAPEETYKTGEPFTYDAAGLRGRELAPGMSVIISVGYQPDEETLSETTLSFGTTTPSKPRSVDVQLKGTATRRLLFVDQESLDFGFVKVEKQVESKVITITNRSSQKQRVVVKLRDIEGAPFLLGTKALANAVEPGGTATFSVDFDPDQPGAVENEVQVWLQGDTEAEVLIPVKGQGKAIIGSGGGCSCGTTETGTAGLMALLALVGLSSRRRRRE